MDTVIQAPPDEIVDTRLCGAVEMLEGRTGIQRDMGRLETWAVPTS